MSLVERKTNAATPDGGGDITGSGGREYQHGSLCASAHFPKTTQSFEGYSIFEGCTADKSVVFPQLCTLLYTAIQPDRPTVVKQEN